MPSAGRFDVENKAIAHLFSGHAMSDPGVARANLMAAMRHMDPVLPSPRAQLPVYGSPLASETPLAPIVIIAANAAALRNKCA